MPTKQQLENVILDLKEDLRRINRELGQLSIDLPDRGKKPRGEKVVPNERVETVLQRSTDDINRLVTEREYGGD